MTGLVSRRALLRGGVVVGAAVALGAAVRLPAPAPGRLVLSTPELAIVAAIAATMFPSVPAGAARLPSGMEAGVPVRVDEILGTMLPGVHAAGVRALLAAVEWGAMASHGARFSHLGQEARAEVLGIWSDPGILARRVAMDALKMVFAMAYFTNAEVLSTIGWRATCGGRFA
jgi:hypothetical protein